MRKVALVTGCAGLLGTHYTRYLLDKGWRVVGVDDLSLLHVCVALDWDSASFQRV